jgi:hypothetical protein
MLMNRSRSNCLKDQVSSRREATRIAQDEAKRKSWDQIRTRGLVP